MKRSLHLALAIAAALLAAAALPAHAQMFGMPLADDAPPVIEKSSYVTAGMMFGEETSYYGLRGTYALTGDIRVFADVGIADIKDDLDGFEGGNEMGVQAGLLYSLRVITAVDLALRAAGYFSPTTRSDAYGANAMVLASRETPLSGLSVYGGAGLDLMILEGEGDPDMALALGVLFGLTEQTHVFVEVGHRERSAFGGGLRYSF